MEAQDRYESWLADDAVDEQTKQELRSLDGNNEEVQDRFYKSLEFGTGGMRGKLGAGTNRMNVYTVKLATQALANTLLKKGQGDKGAAIAYDSRNMSRVFAETAAGVLLGNGIPVFMFEEIAPTPLLSFAVRHFQAGAGIVITASHNPPEYNGYKVYGSDGVQLLPDDASAISTQLESLSMDDVREVANPCTSSMWNSIGQDTIDAYYDAVRRIAPSVEAPDELKILYTPLHGTGARFVPEVLRNAGFTGVQTVTEQMTADGNFPTVSSPNPEEAAAFQLGFKMAERENFDIILATDPDADRVGAAVYDDARWKLLTGNQIGILLSDFILSTLPESDRQNAVVIKTIVTTEMIEPIAQKYGAEVMNTLTGFKYIGALIGQLEKEGKEFAFGFEESYGYLAGSAVRDKDAVLTSLLIAQLAAHYKAQGKTLVERLDELMQEHGHYAESLRSYAFSSSVEAQRARELIAQLRREPITSIAGEQVVAVLDYGESIRTDIQTQQKSVIDLPKEDVIQWLTSEGSKITLRPSGTEPKMKLYLGVRADSRGQAEERLQRLEQAVNELVRTGLED